MGSIPIPRAILCAGSSVGEQGVFQTKIKHSRKVLWRYVGGTGVTGIHERLVVVRFGDNLIYEQPLTFCDF